MTYTEKKKTGKPAEAEPTAPKERETVIQTRPAAVSDLPVYSFVRLQKASPYVEPPDSSSEALLRAIDQTNEESDEDAETRDAALKVLAGFKNQNSITAIAQMRLPTFRQSSGRPPFRSLPKWIRSRCLRQSLQHAADPTREVAGRGRTRFIQAKLRPGTGVDADRRIERSWPNASGSTCRDRRRSGRTLFRPSYS